MNKEPKTDSLKNQSENFNENFTHDKEQIIIDGEKYNKCNGCKLWDGYICTGDRSYEPNAEAHRAICNEHMAKEFWKVYHELFYKTQECEELKKYIQEREVWGDHCEFCKHNDKENCHQNIILDNLKTINRYRKALEEIEEATKEISNYLNIGCDMDKCEDCNHFKPFCTNQCVCFLIGQGDLILDIINKAKGGDK